MKGCAFIIMVFIVLPLLIFIVVPTFWNFINLVISSHAYDNLPSLLSLLSNTSHTTPLLLPSIGFVLVLAVVLLLAQRVGGGWLVELFGASIASILIVVLLFISIIALFVIVFVVLPKLSV
jgi:hypothetical protein